MQKKLHRPCFMFAKYGSRFLSLLACQVLVISEHFMYKKKKKPLLQHRLFIFQARILECVAVPLFRKSSQTRDRTQVSHIAGRFFLPSEPSGKPKNIRLGSPSLLQRIFLTQEQNQDLLHCRCILYQLSYQGSPKIRISGNLKRIRCMSLLGW